MLCRSLLRLSVLWVCSALLVCAPVRLVRFEKQGGEDGVQICHALLALSPWSALQGNGGSSWLAQPRPSRGNRPPIAAPFAKVGAKHAL